MDFVNSHRLILQNAAVRWKT